MIYTLPVRSGNRVLFAGKSQLQSIGSVQGRAAEGHLDLTRQGVDPSLLNSLAVEQQVTGSRVFTDQYSPANLMLNSD